MKCATNISAINETIDIFVLSAIGCRHDAGRRTGDGMEFMEYISCEYQ